MGSIISASFTDNDTMVEGNENNKRQSVVATTAGAASTTTLSEEPPTKKQRRNDDDNQYPRKGKATSKKKVKTKHMDPQVLRIRKIIQEACRTNDLAKAMEAYEEAILGKIRVEAQSYYNLLNLCDGLHRDERRLHVGTPKDPSGVVTEKHSDTKNATTIPTIDSKTRQEYVFRIKERMQSKEISLSLNETAYSAIVKILSKNKEFEKAEEILNEAEGVQQCKPKLRLYASLLHAYCLHDDNNPLIPALRVWKRMRQRAHKLGMEVSKVNEKGGLVVEGLDLTEREYLSLIRCAVKSQQTAPQSTGLVMEDVLTRLAEDITVPAKDTVSSIVDWFQAQNNWNITINESSSSSSQEAAIVQDLLDEIRSYDTITQASPRMGPVTLSDGKKWTISPACSIDAKTGILSNGCLQGHALQPVPLTEKSFQEMLVMNESIVTDGNIKGNAHSKFQGGRKGKRRTDFSPENRKKAWKDFRAFLERNGPYDVVIDGANVGYFKQNFASAPQHVDYEQIDWVVRHFLHKLGKRVLLVMHQRHFSRQMLPDRYRPLIDAWNREGLLYKTPAGMNDDWFWMHAALEYKTLVLTNDEMRDHHFQMLAPKFFLRWKEKHQVHFDFGNWVVDGNQARGGYRHQEVLLTYPDLYSRRIQRVANGLVVPLTKRGDENRFLDGCHVASEDEPAEERYLCICPASDDKTL